MAEAQVRISIDEWARPEEVASVEAAAREFGLDGPVEANLGFRSVEVVAWHVLVTLSEHGIDWLLGGIVGKWGVKAAEKFREFVRSAREARKDAPVEGGTVTVIDDKGNWLVIGDDVPDEAYDKLLAGSWEDLKGGYLLWDKDAGEWKDHTPGR